MNKANLVKKNHDAKDKYDMSNLIWDYLKENWLMSDNSPIRLKLQKKQLNDLLEHVFFLNKQSMITFKHSSSAEKQKKWMSLVDQLFEDSKEQSFSISFRKLVYLVEKIHQVSELESCKFQSSH